MSHFLFEHITSYTCISQKEHTKKSLYTNVLKKIEKEYIFIYLYHLISSCIVQKNNVNLLVHNNLIPFPFAPRRSWLAKRSASPPPSLGGVFSSPPFEPCAFQ